MDISAMDPKDIPGLFDAEVVGPDGEKVGTVSYTHLTLPTKA